MYNIGETVLPIYINGQYPIIKTCSDVTLNLSSKDYTCDCVLSQLIDNVNIGHIDSIVQSFTKFVYDCAACAYCKTGEGKINKVTKPKNLWFDDKCIQARNEFKNARNRFLKNKSEVNRQHFI